MRKRLPTAFSRDEAMDAAFRLLARRSRSEAEITAALIERGASRSLAARVLGTLRRLGYIDDRKLADECAERWRERGFGSLRIRAELAKLGVEQTIAERVMPAAREERGNARRVLRARFGEIAPGDRPRQARAYRFLAGRGFPEEVLDGLFETWE